MASEKRAAKKREAVERALIWRAEKEERGERRVEVFLDDEVIETLNSIAENYSISRSSIIQWILTSFTEGKVSIDTKQNPLGDIEF